MPKKLVFLKSEQDFSNFKKSRSLVSANFRLRWYFPEQKNQNTPRFGFIVPKKTIKKVTDRNLVKRRVKSLLNRHITAIKPADILFFPKTGTIKLKFAELEQEVIGLLKKAGVYEGN
ncbi:MAG TPA: ribonuclease P protein component [Candidatus Binatia bacterium]|nr:ribonuclease P protein component [Candidatus Binatia bacterium]